MKKTLQLCTLMALAVATGSVVSAADLNATDPTTVTSSDPETVAAESNDSTAWDDSTELEEFVIVQQQKLVKSDGATLTYNVAEDPEAGSSNILDILRKVPGITIDAEENVKVNGQSSFKILMDGRENPMLKGDLKTVLKSLPAASIKRIEVISEPGAKYEAEGVGGILNIVTDKKQDVTGFLTQASAWVNAYQAGGYLNGRVKLNKVMLDATVNYNDGTVWPRSQTSNRTLEYLDNSDYLRQEIWNKSKSGWDYTGTSLNLSWEPDTLNLFTLSANYGYNTWFSRGQDTRTMILPDESVDWSVHRDYHMPGKYNSAGAQVSYQHNFGRDTHSITGSYEYWFARQHTTNNYWLDYLVGSGSDSPFSSALSKMTYITQIAQLDYTNKFNAKHLFEAGAKMNLNANRSFNRTYYGATQEESTEASAMRVSQPKDIYALYGTYTGSFAKWSVKGGLRYEHTRMGMRYPWGEYRDFMSYLNDWVPNAAVSYNISDATALRFAYQMRISRPQLYQVNPYVESVTPGQISYGNPDLTSEKGHTFSLSYNNYEGAFSGGATLTYRYTDNEIVDIMFMKDDVLNTTYANAGTAHSARLDLNGSWNITPSLQWTLFCSGGYVYENASSELLKAKSAGWQTNVSTGLYYTLPNRLRLSLDGSYWSPWRAINCHGTTGGYWYGLGASRSFLKDDALTVRLSASSFLPATRSNGYVQEDPSVRYTNSGRFKQWNVGMSISFKFGALKANVKKTNATIEKEDNGGGGNSKGK